MAVFSAHLDDSGTHSGSPLAIVGGIVLSEKGSGEFDRGWRGVLAKPEYRIKVFHGADCDAGRGEFNGWNSAKSHDLSLELANVLSSRVLEIIAIGVRPPDFEFVWEELALSEIGIKNDIYRVLLELCWHKLGDFAQRLTNTDTLAIYVEKGNKRASFVNDLYQKVNTDPRARKILRIKQIAFVDKDFAPLQGADLLVHEVFKYHPNWGTAVMGEVLRAITTKYDRNSVMLLDRDQFKAIMTEKRNWDSGFIKI